ncbi:NmrA family NAD(P)-binding protein [Moritella sp. JT01]|uniref:NmrA family NAD(P)-binding protein n=1 Tax=Moritella sp. JT01 TaxID=756698 RepID=UPI0012F8BF06|nr:NmrA family NAD(P)-binding protein [Moritella sp. JT01]
MMNNNELYVVTGVTGNTGSVVANTLLKAGKRVRVVIRDAAKGNIWAGLGAEVAIADFTDIPALTKALSGADGAYIISPPKYALDDLFTQAEIIATSFSEAAMKAKLPKIVALSSIGADKSSGTGWIAMNRVLEQYLSQTEIPVTFLRPAYFMENWTPMIKSITQGKLNSFLTPAGRKIPMISTQDVGRIAAEALCESWSNNRVIELEGPTAYSPDCVAIALTQALGITVGAIAIPEPNWTDALSNAGFSAPAFDGFVEMTRGLNSGHLAFSDDVMVDRRKGDITLENIIGHILRSS